MLLESELTNGERLSEAVFELSSIAPRVLTQVKILICFLVRQTLTFLGRCGTDLASVCRRLDRGGCRYSDKGNQASWGCFLGSFVSSQIFSTYLLPHRIFVAEPSEQYVPGR